ncbi:enoyl-CoA hydratase/isomerase family protein [Corynebacterium endometrii]|uniref:3-hydroxyisobutyryl-CoA hydrolase n=1 Tax=Corynebacterium endometrii TaxID=2488819 RepID=A0A4P7QFY0_9CORY|nr:enoyl-CoA hydratase/isomerase family protein [Corynebacterium endometrii]QCB27567.1 putative enoyl-CoA hydratase echA8 [Corynebacterium endometrii]
MTDQIISEIQGKAGILTLNRPKAINALNLEMVLELTRVLKDWEHEDSVQLVIFKGAGDRGLCAGGDIAMLYRDALEDGTEGVEFWREEYQLDYLISRYTKPTVAIMNGIVLGGGIGIAGHCSHRVVTDDTRVGMPEVNIGFSPDVGGSRLLANAPDNLGRHLAYTAGHVGPAEAIDTGFADYYVPKEQIEKLINALAENGVDDIAKYAEEIGQGFGVNRDEMVDVYSAPTIEDILKRLEDLASDKGAEHWAADALKRIRRNSPLGLKVTEYSLNLNGGATVEETLTNDFWMSAHFQRDPDFAEGVRAQIIDKDRNPQWNCATLESVSSRKVKSFFTPIDKPGFEPPQFQAV